MRKHKMGIDMEIRDRETDMRRKMKICEDTEIGREMKMAWEIEIGREIEMGGKWTRGERWR
jgi:hypothetical protein